MFFGKKDDGKMRKCEECGSRSEAAFKFCPHCGNSFVDVAKEKKDYGLLGRTDSRDIEEEVFGGFNFTDKIFNSMLNSVMKNLDKQLREQAKNMDAPSVKHFPNGIRIKISGPIIENQARRKQPKVASGRAVIGEEQIRKMSSLPREKAKTNVKRLGNKVVYELATPGVISPQDIFISKLESGYEIKAIGDKKIYVNSIPINLPLHRYAITDNKLLVEFFTQEQ